MQISVKPITTELGAEVHVDASDVLRPGIAGQVLAALNRHHVLVFPQVHMNDDQFLGLTAAMGEKHDNGIHRDGSEASKKGIFRVALDKDEKVQRDIIQANDFWHMDGMNYAGPVKATMLKCESAPREGGDTGFALLHAAYEALPEERKKRLVDLRVGHSIGAALSRLYDEPSAEDIARWNSIFPRMERPLVWRQHCGKSSLLIGSTAGDVVGMSPDEGRALLDELLEWSTQERFTYRHKWSDGDLVIFNNPALLHRSYPYSDEAKRVMHRTTVKGYEPFERQGVAQASADLY